MDLRTEVAIVSIFGRGHRLAVSLAEHNVPVALLDISSQMGSWQPDDVEGPFGFFELSPAERESLEAGTKATQVPQGFTFWLSDGPIELKGPTSAHSLSQRGIGTEVQAYLKGEAKPESLKHKTFADIWLAHFAHYFSSSVETLSLEAMKEGLKRNLLADFHIRHVEPKDHEKSLQWCESKGVKVLRHVELMDLSFEDGRLTDLEIRTDKPGLFKANQFVFCLTSEESAMLSQRIQSSLFSKGVIEPEWVWARFRLKMQSQGPLSQLIRDQLPLHCVLIEDLMLPWTHENMMVLQRTLRTDEFNAWMKIPNNQRFHSQYLNERRKNLTEFLEKKIPENHIEVLEMPIEADSTFQKVGPARHPIFSRSVKAILKNHQAGNIFYDSPEFWSALSFEGQFEHEKKIEISLKAMWDRKEELRLKREAKEAAKRKKQQAKESGKDTEADL